MKANFDSPLKIDGGEKIKAKGPLVWSAVPPTGTQCAISATITQNVGGTQIVGVGNWNKKYNAGDPTWDGDCETDDGDFEAGQAYALGVITVTKPDQPPQTYPWGQWVTLTL